MRSLDTLRNEIAELTDQARALTETESGEPVELDEAGEEALRSLTDSIETKTKAAERLRSINDVVGHAQDILSGQSHELKIDGRPAGPSDVSRTMSFGEYAQLAAKGELPTDEIHDVQRAMAFRALAAQDTSNAAGILPPAWLTDIVDFIGVSRPFISAFDQRPLPDSGLTINYPRVTTKPSAAAQSAENAEVSSTATVITNNSVDVDTYGGGESLSVQMVERTDPGYLAIVMELYAEEMAVTANVAAHTAALAAITQTSNIDGTTNTAGQDINAAFANAAKQVHSARLGGPDTLVMGLDVWEWLAGAADSDGRPLFPNSGGSNPVGSAQITGGGMVSNLGWVVDPTMPAAKAVLGNRRAFSSFLGPVRTLGADVPATLSKDYAVYQYGAFAIRRPDALVEMTLV